MFPRLLSETFSDSARRLLLEKKNLKKGSVTEFLLRNLKTHEQPPQSSSCNVNCGGAQAGYLGRRASVCRKEKKKGAKPGRREGDLKAQHFFGLDDKNHGVKEEEEEEEEEEENTSWDYVFLLGVQNTARKRSFHNF